MSAKAALSKIFNEYCARNTLRMKIIDVYLVYLILTAVIQLVYCGIVGTFPFNSFLAGFICTLGTFVLTGGWGAFLIYSQDTLFSFIHVYFLYKIIDSVSLRLQVNPLNDFKGRSEERAFADYLFCNLILFLVVFNFMG